MILHLYLVPEIHFLCYMSVECALYVLSSHPPVFIGGCDYLFISWLYAFQAKKWFSLCRVLFFQGRRCVVWVMFLFHWSFVAYMLCWRVDNGSFCWAFFVILLLVWVLRVCCFLLIYIHCIVLSFDLCRWATILCLSLGISQKLPKLFPVVCFFGDSHNGIFLNCYVL